MAKAFDILKTWNNCQYVVTSERWNTIMLYMYPNISRTQMELYLYVLAGGNEQISKQIRISH